MHYLKGDRALGDSTLRNSFKLVLKQTGTNSQRLELLTK